MKSVSAFVALSLATGLLAGCVSREPAMNPDPNHTHADFAVFVLGQKLDFTDKQYMSNPYEEEEETSFLPFVEHAIAHGDEEEEEDAIDGRKYLHLHDGIGHVIHRHKPGLTVHDFFDSIGLPMTDECLTLDDLQFSRLQEAEVSDLALTKTLCSSSTFQWSTVINGQKTEGLPYNYEFTDEDKILLSYGNGEAWMEEYETLTDDACLYSKTCPWRGDPPQENCIADPEVPCVIPE